VNDPRLVRRLQRGDDLFPDEQRLVERERAARQPVGERLPGNELEHQVDRAVLLVEAVDRADVRVFSAARSFASRRCRASRSGRAASSAASVLIATRARASVACPPHLAIPPRPSGARIS